jgi:hypothetical protein
MIEVIASNIYNQPPTVDRGMSVLNASETSGTPNSGSPCLGSNVSNSDDPPVIKRGYIAWKSMEIPL